MSTQKTRTGATPAKQFDTKSAPFYYSLLVFALAILAAAGVDFGATPDQIAGDFFTTLSGSGIIAALGILAASIGFPIWNVIQKGQKLNFKNLFASRFTWIAAVNVFVAAVALTGFVLPDGTAEQILKAIETKDLFSLLGFFMTSILPALIRFIKQKQLDAAG